MKKIFAAIIPGWKGRELPAQFPLYIRFAMRSSVIIAHVFSLLKFGRTFGMLSTEKRVELLEFLYNHPFPAVRNVVQWWKLTALMLQC